MAYVLSRYNCFKKYNNITVGVNLFTGYLFVVETWKYDKLIEYQDNLGKLQNEMSVFFNTMCKLGIIRDIESDGDINQILLLRNRKNVFDSTSYRLMILPTLDCNFDCWYCYETRSKGKMTQDTVNSVVLFINKIVKNKSSFFLDWYGGEPMLCFENIIKPITLKTKEVCTRYGVYFESQITTNGYLLNEKMIPFFKNANMQTFQITLNGNREIHNKIRFQKNTMDSYDRIVENIILLAERLEPKTLILRINFAKIYFNAITDIIDSFPIQIRTKIMINIKQIDQDEERISFEDISSMLLIFEQAGFNTECRTKCFLNTSNYACPADTYNQAIINYDGRIFKCHAINFKKETEDGLLTEKGEILWNEEKLSQTLNKATFDNEQCLKCKYLPVCFGFCSYRLSALKSIEDLKNKCAQKDIESNIYYVMDKFNESGKSLAYILNYK